MLSFTTIEEIPDNLPPHYTSCCFSVASLYLSRFLSNFYIPPYEGKVFKFTEFTFLENALIWGIFSHAPLHSKFASKCMTSHPRQRDITHSPRQHSFEKVFPWICFFPFLMTMLFEAPQRSVKITIHFIFISIKCFRMLVTRRFNKVFFLGFS